MSRVRGRIEAVLGWATVRGYRTGVSRREIVRSVSTEERGGDRA